MTTTDEDDDNIDNAVESHAASALVSIDSAVQQGHNMSVQ